MKIAMVVPVAAVEGEPARWPTLAHRYIPLAHAHAQAARGEQVHVFFDGPPRTLTPHPGVTVHVCSGRLPRPRGALRSPHLVQAAARLRPDVLHLHHLLALENLAAAVALHPCVFAEFHGGAPPRWSLKRAALRAVSARLRGAFFPAEAYRRALVEAGAWHPRVKAHVSPETTSRFEGLLAHREGSAGPRVLVVARAESPKAPLATVAVLERIAARAPTAQLRWACPGGAELLQVRHALADRPTLDQRLALSPIPSTQMAEAYAWADVLVATSEREIGGTVMSEALSQGTPVAAFWLPTFEALAGDSPAVTLLRGRDPDRLAAAALTLAGRPRLRAAARERFEGKLSFEAIAEARARIYARCVSH